ncbi:MAG: iron-sulfur cluster-binding protein [Gammaproteobacteria bacterium]|nr:MAG: iron-sulfur cluster-binding protein [Gammaproteobacteria bacterium]
MTLETSSKRFPEQVRVARADVNLQQALGKLKLGLSVMRSAAVDRLPEFDRLRDEAAAIRDHTLNHLDHYLLRFEAAVKERGGHVHFAPDAAAANAIILDICRAANARKVTKGKSMVTEEIELNHHLAAHGITCLETDLGEYIVQLRNERPSHIVAPAIHVVKAQVAEAFAAHHGEAPPGGREEASALMAEARSVIRRHFLEADVGITGANFAIAETGTTVIVTNEGNGDLTQSLPKVHIAVTGIEKIVPTLEDASTLIRLLSRSATGQEASVYNTFSTGPRRPEDPDGPEAFHVVLVDNGRSSMLGTAFQDMLRCIRCGACLNHCPVYGQVGGQAYGSVYPGPMGAVLTPSLAGIDAAGHLPNASTFCGACEAVCPVRIPLPKMMRHWREREFDAGLAPRGQRIGIAVWAFAARRPRLYRLLAGTGARLLKLIGGRRGHLSRLPLGRGWTAWRDLPAPAGETFHAAWRRRRSEE